MKILFTTAILLYAFRVMGCECSFKKDFKDTSELKQYDFIALVKIVKAAGPDPKYPYSGARADGNIQMEVKELFKGQSVTTVFDPNFNSNCALYLEPGEQWLFFGWIYKGRVDVGRCSYTVRYNDIAGVREWFRFDGIKQLALLRKLYGHPVISNNTTKVFYPNGKIEIEQSFKNKELNGIRKIYYPDGKIYVEEQFKNGRRVGYRDVYDATGQLTNQVVYKGDFILQNILYQDTTYQKREIRFLAAHPETSYWGKKKYAPVETLIQIDSVQILKKLALPGSIYSYKPDGRSYTYQCFYFDGKLKSETTLDWNKGWARQKEYFPNGRIYNDRVLDKLNNKEMAHYYAKNGAKEEELSGRCSQCEYYFVADAPPEGTPEIAYIQ
jgi:antitoxin component YwqK of YwqJK toxin-antitoxin module